MIRDRFLWLKSLSTFAGMDDDGISLLAEYSRHRRFREGEVLVAGDAPVSAIYIVTEGQVDVTRGNGTVIAVRPGFGVGMLHVLARDQSARRAVAAVDTTVLEIPAAAVRAVLEENFSFVRNSMRLMSSGLLSRRGNLPADPARPPKVELGEWRDRPLTFVQRMLAMSTQLGIFSRTNVDAIVDLARVSVEARVEPGELLWKIGDRSLFTLRLDYGRVRCTSADGRHVDVGANFILGTMDMFSGRPRSFEARAETKAIVLRLDMETYLNVLETHTDLGLEMLAIFARAVLDDGPGPDPAPATAIATATETATAPATGPERAP